MRAWRVLAIAAALVAVPVPAFGNTGDDRLAEHLESSTTDEFHGSGVVVCTWGTDTASASYEVTRNDGMTMTSGPTGDLMATAAYTVMRAGDEWYAVDFADRSPWSLSARYRLADPEATVHMGRSADVYVVFEGDRPRVRLVVDRVTTVPLVTEILDGEGRVFRMAALIDLDDTDVTMPAAPQPTRMHMVESTDPVASLPESLAGYRRMDTYVAAGGGVQAYYSDGLFSFSVFEAGRGATPEVFRGATAFGASGTWYRRVVTPDRVWVYWNAPNRSYILVGDLPPDHLVAALDGLPKPGERALIVRMWRRLFG
jgi:hypothetical protein